MASQNLGHGPRGMYPLSLLLNPIAVPSFLLAGPRACRGWKRRPRMRAAVVPAPNGKWEIRDVPDPKPGPKQVLIKLRASGICYTDVHQTQGALPGNFPRILGHEPVGEILAVGAGVTSRKVRDRVGVPWLQASCERCEWCSRGKP